MISWICGIQCVAFNMQIYDENFDINAGLFQINGNCGYVLKLWVLLDGKSLIFIELLTICSY